MIFMAWGMALGHDRAWNWVVVGGILPKWPKVTFFSHNFLTAG
jgi:hypothetical protein